MGKKINAAPLKNKEGVLQLISRHASFSVFFYTGRLIS